MSTGITQADTIATRYKHTLTIDSLDRDRPFQIREILGFLLNHIQTQRIAEEKTLIIVRAPHVASRHDYKATIEFITKEALTKDEQMFINFNAAAKKRKYNEQVGETLEPVE